MKYFLIAGEASGDVLAARLMEGILKEDPRAEFCYWGGDAMAKVAPGLKQHYKDIAIMGFIEVLLKIREIKKNLKRCEEQIKAFAPDVLILVDYPGFNLRMARFAKSINLKTCYYIAPKIWAWNEKRGNKLEKYVDLLLLIFPFETRYFKKWKVNSIYVGNPLVEQVKKVEFAKTFLQENTLKSDKPIIALLPGSRKQEINKMLPVMLQVAQRLPNYQFVIAGAPGLDSSFYENWLNHQVKLIFGETHQLLKHATAAIVCSGTATLETAIFNVPQVCGYVANPISYFIGKRLVKVKYISLVNLNLDKPVITELIQHEYTADRLLTELKYVLPGGLRHQQMMQDYQDLQNLFGEQNTASKAAAEITRLIKTKPYFTKFD